MCNFGSYFNGTVPNGCVLPKVAIEFIFVGGIRIIDDLYHVVCLYVFIYDNEFNAH